MKLDRLLWATAPEPRCFACILFIHCNLRVYQFSNGLIYAKGNQADPIRWDQVTSVVQQARRRGVYFWGGIVGVLLMRSRITQSFIVQRNDRATFKFKGILKNAAQLGQSIQQAVMQQHMPRAMAAYNGGSAIPFGPLTVSMQGLSNGREILPWNEVQSIDVKQGQVIVKRVGKTFNWANINVSQIPNLLVFMGLVNYTQPAGLYGVSELYPHGKGLLKGGAKREVATTMFTELEAVGREDLVSIGATLASLIFSKTNPIELDWLNRRLHDMTSILRESPLFQQILQEGREEALEKGRAATYLDVSNACTGKLAGKRASGFPPRSGCGRVL